MLAEEIKGFVDVCDGGFYVCADTAPHDHSAHCQWELLPAWKIGRHLRWVENQLAAAEKERDEARSMVDEWADKCTKAEGKLAAAEGERNTLARKYEVLLNAVVIDTDERNGR